MPNRISHINQNIFIGFVLLNLVCIGYFSYIDPEKWMIYGVFLMNLFLLWYHIAQNTRFWKEHEELFSHFSEFIKHNTTPTLFPE